MIAQTNATSVRRDGKRVKSQAPRSRKGSVTSERERQSSRAARDRDRARWEASLDR